MFTNEELIAAATAIHSQRYADAEVTFLAGSLIRGEGTSTSDLDLVVVFKRIANAYRESFRFGQWPVEAFVHDPATLTYFFLEVDRRSGIPSLPTMVSEGIEIPSSNELSRSLKEMANRMIADGPPSWKQTEIDASRYAITNFVDDLREPRSRTEQMASASAVYGVLSNHYLRRRGLWSAKDKAIPRRLRHVDPAFAARFDAAFETLFRDGESGRVIELAEEILTPDGGWLFDGYILAAPPESRISGTAVCGVNSQLERLHFRAASVEDAAVLAPLNAQLIRDEGHRNAMCTAQLAERMAGWLRGGYQAVLFEDAEEVVGYALFRLEAEHVYLRHLFVLPGHRRRGIGRQALKWLWDNCWVGIPRLRIDVLVGNSGGAAFWRSVGFKDYCITMEMEPPVKG